MADDHRHIDQLFRHHLKDYGESPPAYAWDRLKEDLLAVRKRRRVILYRWVAAAAVFILAFMAGYFYASFRMNEQRTANQAVTQTKPESMPSQQQRTEKTAVAPVMPGETDHAGQSTEAVTTQEPVKQGEQMALTVTPATVKENAAMAEELVIASQANEIAAVARPSGPSLLQPLHAGSLPHELAFKTKVQHETLPLLSFESSPQTKEKRYTYDDLAASSNKMISNKWIVGGQFSPVYSYRNIHILEDNLPANVVADKNYYNGIEDGVYSYAGGINVEYLFREKLSLQTGLYYSQAGQVNRDILAFQYPGDKYRYYANTSSGTIPFDLESLPDQIKGTSVRDTSENLLYINSDIYQTFEYLELPLLVKYSVVLHRFSLNVTGGLSPGIMVGNRAYFKFDNQHYDLNRSGDFYSMIYNSVVGVGMDYYVTKKLRLNLTPTFKYSLQSVRKDHSIEYYPYSLSIFTGINYLF